MAWIKFKDRKTPIEASTCIIKPGVVNVRILGLSDYSGFRMYADSGMQLLMGDYTGYTTKYKDSDESGMYASTGEVYQEPEPIPEPEPAPERMEEKDWYQVDIITCAAPNLRKKPSNAMIAGH